MDAKELKYIEEVGTSNIFFVLNDELVTPPLGGTILPGVTRDSVIHLARSWDLDVVERPISIDEVIDGCKNGIVKEAFATGTTGPVSRRLYEEITAIQYGQKPDPFGWVTRVEYYYRAVWHSQRRRHRPQPTGFSVHRPPPACSVRGRRPLPPAMTCHLPYVRCPPPHRRPQHRASLRSPYANVPCHACSPRRLLARSPVPPLSLYLSHHTKLTSAILPSLTAQSSSKAIINASPPVAAS